MSDSIHEPELFVAVKSLCDFLNGRGYRITYSLASKLTMPSADKGPPREGYFGSLPCFDPEKAVAWYRSRVTPSRSLLFRKRALKSEKERRAEQKRRRERSRKPRSAPRSECE
jgi:hypothetical protein